VRGPASRSAREERFDRGSEGRCESTFLGVGGLEEFALEQRQAACRELRLQGECELCDALLEAAATQSGERHGE
jgi:hypothetical protein